jgi:uncharacterized protein (TIGR02757 family)
MTLKKTELDSLDLKDFLDEMALRYNNASFIETDPIQIPHQFTFKEDIEIAAFLTATIAWGNRKMIIQNAQRLVNLLGNAPFDFVMSHNDAQLNKLDNFVHRTFNGTDLKYFIKSLQHIYTKYNGLETIFKENQQPETIQPAISKFHDLFFEIDFLPRTQKHVANPAKGSVAKRLNMFLRWLCRKDKQGVDFGIWDISPSKLSCPLDVHSGNVARKLGLISQKHNNIAALHELDTHLRRLDPADPVKYDFALFGLGVFERF